MPGHYVTNRGHKLEWNKPFQWGGGGESKLQFYPLRTLCMILKENC